MDIMMLLEQLASCVHYEAKIHDLVNSQVSDIQKAFQLNDTTFIKKQMGSEYTNNPSDVVNIIC